MWCATYKAYPCSSQEELFRWYIVLYLMSQFFFTKSRDDKNYHIAKQHIAARPSKTYKCKLCHAEFLGFHALHQHKNNQHGTQIGFGASIIDVDDIVGDADDQGLRE